MPLDLQESHTYLKYPCYCQGGTNFMLAPVGHPLLFLIENRVLPEHWLKTRIQAIQDALNQCYVLNKHVIPEMGMASPPAYYDKIFTPNYERIGKGCKSLFNRNRNSPSYMQSLWSVASPCQCTATRKKWLQIF